MGKRKHDRDKSVSRKVRRLVEKCMKEYAEDKPRRRSRSSSNDENIDINMDEGIIEEDNQSNVSIDLTVEPPNTNIVGNQSSSGEIPDAILNILGSAKKLEANFGENVPDKISERWGGILLNGISKEDKDKLLEKMLIPGNFTLARAPKLNPEITSILTDTVKNRDKRLEKAQNQLGSGIAGLINLTKDLINSDMEKIAIITKISEISQVLLDLHYEETMNRRRLLVPLLDKKIWSTIQGLKRDDFLFSEKLGENIKNTKEVEKSSSQIKKPSQTSFPRKNIVHPSSGNFHALPPRQPNNTKPAARYHNPQPAKKPMNQLLIRPG